MAAPCETPAAPQVHAPSSPAPGALACAERLCRERGVRLTPLRRRVLEQIWRTHGVVKAYDLIQRLSSAERPVKPPTVYRTLDFLLAQGLIHRIESLNGYVACVRPGQAHDTLLVVCRRCGAVMELEDTGMARTLRHEAARHGFRLDRQVVEGSGLCARCQAD